MTDEPDVVAAGNFSSWVDDFGAALRGERPSAVPCGGCTACCTSSQFVPVGPEETETLRRIPKELLFPAPRRSPGHWVLGYDERGHCPMLIDGQCSIYDHRPKACRTYDCRVFLVTGVDPGTDKRAITDRVRKWRFEMASEEDDAEHRAMAAAARFLEQHRSALPTDAIPAGAAHRAVIAFLLHSLFLSDQAPDLDTVRGALRAIPT